MSLYVLYEQDLKTPVLCKIDLKKSDELNLCYFSNVVF